MGLVSKQDDFVDLSGIAESKSDNPYDALIEACCNDPSHIQSRYRTHREMRNEQQRAKLQSDDFTGFNIDPILRKLLNQDGFPGYADPRNCLVFWARPANRIRELVGGLQEQLLDIAPNLWLMPLDCLHMTVLEVTHSKTAEEVDKMVEIMGEKVSGIADFTYNHRAALVEPMLSYDTAAIALSFLPAGSKPLTQDMETTPSDYTYHHLRRDIYELCKKTGVEVASRYTVPSSHLTIARFVTQKDIVKQDGEGLDMAKVSRLVDKLEEINRLMRKQYWSNKNGDWIVGEEKGLECRKGTLWYGGGQQVHLGRGF